MRRSVRSKSPRSASSRAGSSRSTARRTASEPALYVHLPFCKVKCGYCDFLSYAGVAAGRIDLVLGAIREELRRVGRPLRPRTVFLGGGTPTFLSPARIEALLDALAEAVDATVLEEFTCEANPESCTEEKLQVLVNKGVTRISIGLQAFDEDRLRFLDRPHDVATAVRAFGRARATGAEVSLDLIFGTPGQTVAGWLGELDQAIDLGPDHLSCYHLTFEPGTRLQAARARGEVAEIDGEVGRDLLVATRDHLGAAGFEAYEISNFARPGHECAHNLHYWGAGDYHGIGPGAASHLAGRRWTNLRPLEAYVRAIRSRGSAAAETETLSPEQRCREAVWLGLRLTEGADLAAIAARTGVDPRLACAAEIARQVGEGRCELAGDRLRLAPGRFLFADPIAGSFLAATP